MKQETKLKKSAHAVYYEIWMFRETAKVLGSFNPNQISVQKNVFLESFGTHAYNLYRFFYQGEREKKGKNKIKRKSSDIIVEDFGVKKQFFRKNRTPKKMLKSIEVKRNKQIAHLTYNRIFRNKTNKGWKFGNIVIKMEKTIIAFFSALPDEQKSYFDPKKNKYFNS